MVWRGWGVVGRGCWWIDAGVGRAAGMSFRLGYLGVWPEQANVGSW
jgi:hypothetical protein